jgi:hypothetical protein
VDNDVSPEILSLVSVERAVDKEASPEILSLVSIERDVDKEELPDIELTCVDKDATSDGRVSNVLALQVVK